MQCHNELIAEAHRGKPHPARWTGGGIQAYRRCRKPACERCGSTKNLMVHHRNHNRRDNVLTNLETVCRSCHCSHSIKARDPITGRFASVS
ncbi:MAG: hypothetical protein DMF56_26875 [Acidobacteria bacterium]|nr:MAG: hypothetical protein DMF56_26875 [Acidobacteriota bacterium]